MKVAASHYYPKLERARVEGRFIVAREEDAYIGLPFEGGLWTFAGGRELLVAGLWSPCGYETRKSVNPQHLRRGRSAWRTWRSRDGGRRWKPDARIVAAAEAAAQFAAGKNSLGPAPADPRDPNVLLSAVTMPWEGEVAVLHLSRDRGRTWQGPLRENVSDALNRSFGQPAGCLRPDGSLLLFLTTTHPGGRCRPCVLQMADLTGHRSLIAYLPAHRDLDRICPSPVTLPDSRILVAVTEKPPESCGHTLMFLSDDDGRTWRPQGRANDVGNPAHLLLMEDGRLALTYGVPLPPYRICARLSDDGGKTWGPERIVDEGGGSPDLGSVRSTQRRNGVIVSVYQWNDADDPRRFRGGRRYLAATHWRP